MGIWACFGRICCWVDLCSPWFEQLGWKLDQHLSSVGLANSRKRGSRLDLINHWVSQHLLQANHSGIMVEFGWMQIRCLNQDKYSNFWMEAWISEFLGSFWQQEKRYHLMHFYCKAASCIWSLGYQDIQEATHQFVK